MPPQQLVEIRAIALREPRRLAHVAARDLQQLRQVVARELVARFRERRQRVGLLAERAADLLGGDHAHRRQRDVLPHDVVELANVAGPVARDEQLDGLRRVDLALLAALGGNLPQEMLDEQRDVLAPLAQRGQVDVHDVEPVVEVFAERALDHQVLQVLMRGRDHARVDLDRVGAADGPHLLLLQHAQQLDLQAHRHVADLVEQQRAAVRGLEQSLVRAVARP